MSSITQLALRILEEEKQAALVEEQKRIAAAKAEAAAKEQTERAVRVQLQAERELARIVAERALAEEQALAVQAAEAAALQAELARLRARSEIEVLRDEMAQMRAEMAALKACHLARLPQQDIHLRSEGELDAAIVKTVVTERKFRVTFPRPNEVGGMSCNFKDKDGNIIFHFNPRPAHLVLNSFKKTVGSWGSEEHHPWIGSLQNIWGSELLIKVTPEGFMFSRYQSANFDIFRHRISVNLDEISFDYDQRMTCIEL
jgi:hypothetical protein